MIYQPLLNREQIDKEFSKLTKLKYNQFRWWRMYEPKKKPLHNRHRLSDRILNGDFDFSCYKVQAYWCEHEMNDLWEIYKYDSSLYIEKTSLLRTRRKKLLEDFEKDEADRLTSLIREFTRNFRITREQVEQEMLDFDGSLIEFYYHIDEKYRVNFIPNNNGKRKRGRPRKVT